MSARRTLALAYALSGAAALVYEVAWSRELSEILGSTAYGVASMLGAFMAGLAIGAYAGGRWADRVKDSITAFASVEFAVATFGLVTLIVLRWLPDTVFTTYTNLAPQLDMFLALQFLFVFAVMLPPTIAMGATFPFVARALAEGEERIGESLGLVYATNTAGSVIGSLLGGFVLVPAVGIKGAVIAAALLNIAAASIALFSLRRVPPQRTLALLGVSAGAVMIAVLLPSPPAVQLGFYELGRIPSVEQYRMFTQGSKTLFNSDGLYSRVAVVEFQGGIRTLRNGGMTEGSNGPPDRQMTGLLAAVPLASAAETDNALVIGLGTGYTSLILSNAGIGKVTTVEINPDVVPASKFFIGNDVEKNPNWDLEIQDGRNFLLLNPTTYDLITSEPSWPLNESVGHLFTKEFFEVAKSRLEPDGVFMQWLPNYFLEPEDLEVMYKTLSVVFPNAYVWTIDSQGVPDSEIMLVGINGDRKLNDEEVAEAAEAILKREKLSGTPFRPYADIERLRAAAKDPKVPMNTDDHPYLEFAVVENRVQRYAEERK